MVKNRRFCIILRNILIVDFKKVPKYVIYFICLSPNAFILLIIKLLHAHSERCPPRPRALRRLPNLRFILEKLVSAFCEREKDSLAHAFLIYREITCRSNPRVRGITQQSQWKRIRLQQILW